MPDTTGTSVEVEHFARCFVDDPGEIPPQSEAFRKDDRYYFRLELQGIDDDAAGGLLRKAKESFDVEIVGQVRENGRVVKERVYVESVTDVPGDKKPQYGPQGGIYYEAESGEGEEMAAGTGDGPVDQSVGYDGEPVLAVQFEDIEVEDKIAFERPDTGERDMGRVIDIKHEENMVTVKTGDGTTDVEAAPLEIDTEKSEGSGGDGGGGTLTSGTEGAHNVVYGGSESPDVCQNCHEEDPQEGSMYCASCENELSKDGEDVWVYYFGPQGGEGWQNVRTGEIRYQKERPGAAPEGGDGYGDWLEDGWMAPPDDLSELEVGQTVEVYDENAEEYHEAEVNGVGNGEVSVNSPDIPGEYVEIGTLGTELTAVEEYSPHDDWFDTKDFSSDEYWGQFEDSIPADAPHPGDFDTGDVIEFQTPGLGTDSAEAEIAGYYDSDNPENVIGVGEDGLVLTLDDMYERNDDGLISSTFGDKGDISPAVVITPGETEAIEEVNGEPFDPSNKGSPPDDWEELPNESDALEGLEEGDQVAYQGANEEWYQSEVAHVDESDGSVLTEEDHYIWPEQNVHVPGQVAGKLEEDEQTKPEDILADAGVEIDQTVHTEYGTGEVVGTTSMMQDGEPSHVEVEFDGDTFPLHPNNVKPASPDEGSDGSVSEDAVGEATEPPSEDDDAGDEATEEPSDWSDWTGDYDLANFSEDDVEEWGDLSDFGFPSGVTAHNMRVGALPDWDGEDNSNLVFQTEYGPEGEKVGLGHRQMVTYTVGSAIGGQMPQHVGHAEEEGHVTAIGVEGEDIGSAPAEYLSQVDEEQWYEQAAVQIMMGNNDAHLDNVKVTPSGDLVFHDIDHSAGDITDNFTGQKTWYDDSIDRVLGELWRSGKHVVEDSEVEAKQRMLEVAKEKAAEIEGSEEVDEAINRAIDYDPDLAHNVEQNIKNLAAGNVTWQ